MEEYVPLPGHYFGSGEGSESVDEDVPSPEHSSFIPARHHQTKMETVTAEDRLKNRGGLLQQLNRMERASNSAEKKVRAALETQKHASACSAALFHPVARPSPPDSRVGAKDWPALHEGWHALSH